MIKICPVELAISFNTFRAADGAALNVRSTTLRSIKFAALLVALGSADFCPRAGLPFRAGAGVGFGAGVDEGPCSSGKGARRKEVTLSTLASSKTFMSICIWD